MRLCRHEAVARAALDHTCVMPSAARSARATRDATSGRSKSKFGSVAGTASRLERGPHARNRALAPHPPRRCRCRSRITCVGERPGHWYTPRDVYHDTGHGGGRRRLPSAHGAQLIACTCDRGERCSPRLSVRVSPPEETSTKISSCACARACATNNVSRQAGKHSWREPKLGQRRRLICKCMRSRPVLVGSYPSSAAAAIAGAGRGRGLVDGLDGVTWASALARRR